MKTKLIGLLICLMLLTTLFAAAKPANTILEKTSAKTQTASTMVDVPVWAVGDTWTYQVDDISINYTTEPNRFSYKGLYQSFPLK